MRTAVYVAIIDRDTELSPVYPPQRQADIDRCSNEGVRLEKYTAWRLLELALRQSLGLDFKSLEFLKNSYGKWNTEGAFFSISHSGGAVAVAVSDKPVGVDIEVVERYREGIEHRILTPSESIACKELDAREAEEYIIRKWSEKESIFKTLDIRAFEPLKIETKEYPVKSQVLDMLGKRFVLSVCSQDIDGIEYHLNTQI